MEKDYASIVAKYTLKIIWIKKTIYANNIAQLVNESDYWTKDHGSITGLVHQLEGHCIILWQRTIKHNLRNLVSNLFFSFTWLQKWIIEFPWIEKKERKKERDNDWEWR